MTEGTYWISKGILTPPPMHPATGLIDERELLHRQGFVTITQDGSGTAIKWEMFTPNWAPLTFPMEWRQCRPGPNRRQARA